MCCCLIPRIPWKVDIVDPILEMRKLELKEDSPVTRKRSSWDLNSDKRMCSYYYVFLICKDKYRFQDAWGKQGLCCFFFLHSIFFFLLFLAKTTTWYHLLFKNENGHGPSQTEIRIPIMDLFKSTQVSQEEMMRHFSEMLKVFC